jgi:acyl carrier protein
MNVWDRLTKVFRMVFQDESLQLKPSTTSDDVEGWDSLSHINLLIAIEIEFGIEFKQNEIQAFANVGELEKRIEEKMSAAAIGSKRG